MDDDDLDLISSSFTTMIFISFICSSNLTDVIPFRSKPEVSNINNCTKFSCLPIIKASRAFLSSLFNGKSFLLELSKYLLYSISELNHAASSSLNSAKLIMRTSHASKFNGLPFAPVNISFTLLLLLWPITCCNMLYINNILNSVYLLKCYILYFLYFILFYSISFPLSTMVS